MLFLKGIPGEKDGVHLFYVRIWKEKVAEDPSSGGGSAITELRQALEEYLSVLIGLTKKESGLEDLVEFKWKNLEVGLAVESQKATISVKRRLACEQLIYYSQAYQCLSGCDLNHGYGKKHMWFIKWKFLEAKAAAYYYHGLVLDKGNEPTCHISAVCRFLAAQELLVESKKACISFCLAASVTRAPPLWGAMKHLHQKIPEVASRKSQMYGYLLKQEKALQSLPDLPDFQLSLEVTTMNYLELIQRGILKSGKTEASP